MSEDNAVEVTGDATTEVTEEIVEWGEYTGYVYEWLIPEYGVQLWLRTVPGACGRFKQRWAYRLSWQGKVLYECDDLRCPDWFSPETVVETCMGFLTTQYRDEDDEPYTPRQLEWFQHWHCEATALEADLLIGGES